MENNVSQQLAGAFDVVAGIDEPTLNGLAASIYNASYPNLFKGSIPVGQLDISSIDYDIRETPTFVLNPSNLLMDQFREILGQRFQSNELEISVIETAQASFDVTFSAVSVTVNYSNGQPSTGPISVSVMAAAQAVVNPDNSLAPRLSMAVITAQGDPTLSQILTNIFAPLLVDYLNTHVLAPIKLPVLSFLGASFSVPMVLTQGDTLLAFASLQPGTVVPPESSSWPQSVAFIATDAPAINAVVDGALANDSLNGDWSWSFDLNLGIINIGLELDAQYNLGFSGANFELVPGSDEDVTASFNVSGSASFSAQGGPFHLSFGANISGEVTATAAIDVVGQQVTAIFKSLDNIKVNVDFFGVPRILGSILDLLANAFVPVLAGIIASSFSGKNFKLTTIPTIGFSIDGLSFTVTPKDLAVQTISGPGSVPLLTVTGAADVQMAPHTTHSIRNISTSASSRLQEQKVAQ